MAKRSTVPVQAANTEDEDLPQTAVKEKATVRTIRELQSQLAEYAESEDNDPQPQSNIQEPATSNDPWEKRYGDLRRHTQKKEEKFQTELKQLQSQITQLTQAANQPMPKTKEEFLKWKEQYPDIAVFIEMIADEKASARANQIKEELDSVQTMLKETKKEKAMATLQAMVPDLDVDNLMSDKDFLVWFTAQPEFITDKLKNSDDPEEVAYYLNLYKSTKTPQTNTPAPKVNKMAALDVTVKHSGSVPDRNSQQYKFTTSQIKAMTPREFAKNEVAIDEAERQGLIYDDMARKIRHTDL